MAKPLPLAVDDLLGRSFLFHDGYDIHTVVTVIAHDPDKGWKLDAGPSFTQPWVSHAMLTYLFTQDVLQVGHA